MDRSTWAANVGIMISSYGELLPFDIGSESLDSPHYQIALALRCAVVLLGRIEGLRPVPFRHPLFRLRRVLLLEQRRTELVCQRIGVDHIGASPLR